MSAKAYTVYEADPSGDCWDLCQTDDAAYALKCCKLGRAMRLGHVFGISLTDDPERGDVEAELEEGEVLL